MTGERYGCVNIEVDMTTVLIPMNRHISTMKMAKKGD